jgi:hypothetical protein
VQNTAEFRTKTTQNSGRIPVQYRFYTVQEIDMDMAMDMDMNMNMDTDIDMNIV